MINFCLEFIRSSFDLINFEVIQTVIFTFFGVGAVCFINYTLWGR